MRTIPGGASPRWRVTSSMKNGFPSVSARTERTISSGASEPLADQGGGVLVGQAPQGDALDGTSRRRSASAAASGCDRDRSVSR